MKIVKIALPVPMNTLFSYSLPENIPFDDVLLGRRALVPFGKRNVSGVIVEVLESVGNEKLKQIVNILDDEPVLSENLLKLTKWISEYYFCSWGIALKAALPEGLSVKSVVKVKLLKELSDEDIYLISQKAPKRAAILKLLQEHSGSLNINFIESKLNSSSLKSQIETLEKAGIVSVESYTGKQNAPKTAKAIKLSDSFLNNQNSRDEISTLEKKAPKQALLLSKLFQLSEKKYVFLKDIASTYKISSNVVKELSKKDFIQEIEIEIPREESITSENNLSNRNEIELKLTAEQETVLANIKNNIDKNNFKPILLHGVTGSGKTLIYFHTVKHVLDKGKTVLILVPEISLTPQLIDRFQRTFPEQVAVFHSRMSAGARFDSWKSILDGKKKIVLGVRSAIFSPLKNIGLIIIDEEHEPSYKQDAPEPRYNARDVAIIRAKIENSAIILGSATPSLESMENARTGRYDLYEIKERADGAKLPLIKIINTSEARKVGKLFGSLTEDLLLAIEDKISKKEGVILFLNRRGFAPVLECPDCGFIPECEQCSVPLTYHKKKDKLHCHYCGKVYHTHATCPSCGNPELTEIGFGTQRIEEDLFAYFSEKDIKPIIQRMDLDTTGFKGAHREILTNFSQGHTDILVGTQMVAKGLDFERVTLVGVINADLQLYQPDFRASERTFQLITQVSGRAGRTEAKPGEVIIQTSHPENFAVNAAVKYDYSAFFEHEIEHRKNANYPPFSRFCMIEFSGKDVQLVEKKSQEFYNLLPKKSQSINVYKPFSPYIYKIRSFFRKLIVVKNIKEYDASGKELRKYLNYALSEYNKRFASSKIKLNIDIDSFSSL
ncbi:MAG: primosomal protein N' [bacterium]